MVKKYLLLLWNQRYFLFLAILTILVVIGIRITFPKNGIKSTDIDPKPTSLSQETTVNNSPLQKQENSPPALQEQVNSEDKKTVSSLPLAPSDSEKTYQQTPEIVNNLPEVETYLGHFPYAENFQQQLVKVADFYGREEFLDPEAANAFKQMQADAKANSIDLTIISGFRSISQQEKLFAKQINRRGSKEAAARLSAPPGFSEHHTGYALDIGEGEDIDTFLKFEFENTNAFRWLAENAYKYGFELSFPKDNPQGVSYEPWHWRYLGSPRAATIFESAKFN